MAGGPATPPTGHGGDEAATMRLVASEQAVGLIRERGGSLYVWADLARCLGCRIPFLSVSTEPPAEPRRFVRLSGGPFDLYYDDGGMERPRRLFIELAGWPRRRLVARSPDLWSAG